MLRRVGARCVEIKNRLTKHQQRTRSDVDLNPDLVVDTTKAAREAAILVLLVGPELNVVVLRRTPYLNSNPGEPCLPGGRKDAVDKCLCDTALRETQEEIGIPPTSIEVLGQLDPFLMDNGYLVKPFVGWVNGPCTMKANPNEVFDLIEIPLAHVLEITNYRILSVQHRDTTLVCDGLPYKNWMIWGMTATSLLGFAEIMQTSTARVARGRAGTETRKLPLRYP